MTQNSGGEVFHAALSFSEVGIDLEDQTFLQGLARTIIDYFQLSVVDEYWHRYQPIGLTGVYVLQQSSLTLHTWSEYKKLVIDITTCGKRVDIEKMSADLQHQLQTTSVIVSKEVL